MTKLSEFTILTSSSYSESFSSENKKGGCQDEDRHQEECRIFRRNPIAVVHAARAAAEAAAAVAAVANAVSSEDAPRGRKNHFLPLFIIA